ncbi:MAG: hypothetical protein ABSF95_05885 [Verrucomicrobiota bacterium]|jgi:hypothetical protein
MKAWNSDPRPALFFRKQNHVRGVALIVAALIASIPNTTRASSRIPFSFKPYLDKTPSLQVAVPQISGAEATVDGGDSRRPSIPFTFGWGDGSRSESFFPARHRYAETRRNYTVTVIAHYQDGEAQETETVRFMPLELSFRRDTAIPARVRVASAPVELWATLPGYSPPGHLTGFQDSELGVPRPLLEYILDVGCMLETDFCNRDIDPAAGAGQVVLKAADAGGAFSLWFTRPMAMGADPSYLANLSGVSSLFHELGHNLTLNSPAKYRFGGKTDGPMNTIVSETLAQIMQHATAWELLNTPGRYGLSADACAELRHGAVVAFAITSRAYHDYIAAGCPYCTIQSGKSDPTFGTFMTVAYVFVKKAEAKGAYRKPLKRMLALLQTFDRRDHERFLDRGSEGFRATLMTAALAYGFNEDLRPWFRKLRFPVDDAIYTELMGRMKPR